MTRTGPGWCPFAEQVEGVTSFDNRALQPVGFCDHTAGGFYSTMQSAAFWNGAGVSTHFATARDGRVCQMVNIFQIAFAQGRVGPVVTWPHWRELGSPSPNLLFISTEHEDAETVNGQTQFISGSEWTQEQYDADLRLKDWCRNEYAQRGTDLLKYGIESLTGHHMFDGVNRAECPGRFWRTEYRERLFNDLTGGPMPERNWLYGDENAGEEVVGNQILVWHRGVVIDKIGDEAGQFPGQRAHNEGGVFVVKEP